jgi:SulP family sulfate permease
MILFPLGEQIFENTGPDGISMFYVSCIVSQLIFSCGGSVFKGAVGSEMVSHASSRCTFHANTSQIEVVPFFHKMTYTIMARCAGEDSKVIMATVITSYALSSIITGFVFLMLGVFGLGSLVNFFPRHILIGCIGGVGFFLFVTGIEVSARLDGNLEYNLATLQQLFRGDTAPLWIVPLGLSIVLLVSKRFTQSPYLVPAFFVGVAAIFYIVVAAVHSLDVQKMRDAGWIFSAVESGVPFYHFYSYYGRFTKNKRA